MGAALCLRFGHTTAQAIERIWQDLANANVSTDMLRQGYPPHLTLLLMDDAAPAAAFVPELERLSLVAPPSLTLGEPRHFPQSEVVYLSCAGDLVALFELQRLAANVVPLDAIHEHYRPGAWTPHVTLQTTGDTARSLEIARANWRSPHVATPAALDALTFSPIEVVGSVSLP